MPLTAVLVDVISNVVGHLGVLRFAVATVCVLPTDFEQPYAAVFGVTKVIVAGVAHFRRSKATASHQLDCDLLILITFLSHNRTPVEEVLNYTVPVIGLCVVVFNHIEHTSFHMI